MTQPATTRRAGPFLGNGSATSFPFTFKVFSTSDLALTLTRADGTTQALVLGSDYSITLNPDQDAAPGGTITYPLTGSPMPGGASLVGVGALPYDQTFDFPPGGRYRAQSHEDAFDRTVAQIQQLAEEVGRALTLPPSAAGAGAMLPAPEAQKIIGWNDTGTALVNRSAADLATVVVTGTSFCDVFTPTAAQTQFVLSADPGTVNALDVALYGVPQINGIDFTVSGTTLTMTTAPGLPPSPEAKLVVRYVAAVPVGSANAQDVTYASPGGGTPVSLQDVLSDVALRLSGFGADETGTLDATAALQAAIDNAPDGSTLIGTPGAVYKVSKNSALLPAVYPVRAGNTAGEQPCLAIYNRRNLTLDGRGATIRVDTHAQGVLDILRSSGITIQNFKIVGPGAFPPLDGTTGRSEKGTVSAGYYDAAAVANGPARNNSRNTSAYTAGGYGGAFPRVGGGTGATWGTWTGGGYLANVGSGIYIDDASTDIVVTRNEISGFNEGGVQVTSQLTESYGWAACGRVTVTKNYIHDCYNAGVEYHNVSDIDVSGNVIANCGHPNAALTHSVIDPGYGIGSNNGVAPLRITLTNNLLVGNKRKGIDAHSCDSLVITGNVITDSGYGIMLVNGSLGLIRNTIINGNLIARIAYPVSAQATGIYVERNAGAAAGFAGNAVIAGNQIYEVGVPAGLSGTFPGTNPVGIGILLAGTQQGVTVTGNLVQNTNYLGFIGVCSGFAGSDTITGAITGNVVRGGWTSGINNLATGGANSSTVGNSIELTSVSPYAGAQTGINGATDRHFAANNINVPAGQAFMSNAAQGLDLIVRVTMSNTGVVTYTTGFNQGKYVSSVASFGNGLRITLASGIAVQAVSFTQESSARAVKTVGGAVIDYIYARSVTNPLDIGFQAAGAVGTDVPANQITGSITFRVSI